MSADNTTGTNDDRDQQHQRDDMDGRRDESIHPDPSLLTSDEGIVSVNERQPSSQASNRRRLIFLVVVIIVVGAAAWGLSKWLETLKDGMIQTNQVQQSQEKAKIANPEGDARKPVRLGAAGETLKLAPEEPVQVGEVPPIELVGGEQGRKALPGGSPQGGGSPGAPKASRYGGALEADGGGVAQGFMNAGAASQPGAASPAMDVLKMLAALGQGKPAAGALPGAAGQAAGGEPSDAPSKQPAGSVGSQLTASVTPVRRAAWLTNQDMLLPKGRQMDCILTSRIINEQPGFTTCVLAQNLYSDNGKVLLAEKGSEFVGEYGIANQAGLRRLFIVWTRLKTRDGIQIDLMSPGSDSLGTSGVPGYLEQRWMERIGTALMISIMQDALAYAAQKNLPQQSQGSLFVPPERPLENTQSATEEIVTQIIRQTINVRPTLYINEGERVAVYVARDLDFGTVYGLKHAGRGGR